MSDIFISYASADRARAKLLSTALDRQGWTTWWDRTIPPGKEYDEVIEEALDCAKCVVVLWSRTSVASSWVKTEAAEAMHRKILVPALIDDAKIPLEFRRLQAADLSQWQGEPDHAGLAEFFQSIELKIHGIDETTHEVKSPAPSVDPRPVIQRERWTRAAWPTVALIVTLVGAVSGLSVWRFRQAGHTDTSPAVIPVKDMSAVNLAPTADPAVVDRPDPVSQPQAAPEPGAGDRSLAVGRRPATRNSGGIADSPAPVGRPATVRDPDVLKPAKPVGTALVETSPVPPEPVTREPVAREPISRPVPPETPPTPTGTGGLPVAVPKQFEDILFIVTKDGETEEQDAILAFGDTSLVVKDEDANVLRAVPYSKVQTATYSRTQRRVMFIRTTRHRLTMRVDGDEVVLQLPADTTEAILSQLEQHTSVKIARHVE